MSDPLDLIQVGGQAEVSHCIGQADLDRFVDLTGDDNPLHVSADFAAATPFRRPVVHGMLTASFISTLIGTRLPARRFGTSSTFALSPPRVGENIIARAKVLQKSSAQRTLVLQTLVTGEGGRVLIDGEAKVKVMQPQSPSEQKAPTQKGSVLITGAAGGIGSAIARRLAADGWRVILHYNRSAARAAELADEIARASGKAATVQADLCDPASLEAVLQAASEAGPVQALVNNACPAIVSRMFADLTWDEVGRHIDVQLRSAFELL